MRSHDVVCGLVLWFSICLICVVITKHYLGYQQLIFTGVLAAPVWCKTFPIENEIVINGRYILRKNKIAH